MKESLISEAIEPVMDETAELPFQAGEPILPSRFRWREREYRIETVLESWKQYSPGTSSMPDRYLRKHWYHVRTDDGSEMKLYFERKARGKGSEKSRWWIYTILGKGG